MTQEVVSLEDMRVESTQTSILSFTRPVGELLRDMIKDWVKADLMNVVWQELSMREDARKSYADVMVVEEFGHDMEEQSPVGSKKMQAGMVKGKKIKVMEPKKKTLAALAMRNKKMTDWLVVKKVNKSVVVQCQVTEKMKDGDRCQEVVKKSRKMKADKKKEV